MDNNSFQPSQNPNPTPSTEPEQPQPSQPQAVVSEPDTPAAPTPTVSQPVFTSTPATPSFSSVSEESYEEPKTGMSRTTAYLPEYAVMLILLAVVLSSITSLLSVGLSSLAPVEQSANSAFSMFGDIDSFQLVWSLSALIATVPFFAFLFIRTRNTESDAPATKTHRWRKAFLGIFLVIQGLTVVTSIGVLAFDLLGRAIAQDTLSTGNGDPLWVPITATVLSVALLSYVIFVMSRDYRVKQG